MIAALRQALLGRRFLFRGRFFRRRLLGSRFLFRRGFLAGALFGCLFGDQFDGLLHGHGFGVAVLGQGRVDLVPFHIRPVFAFHDCNSPAIGVFTQIAQGFRSASTRTARGDFFGQQLHGVVHADRKHLVKPFEIGVGAAAL